MIVIKLGSAFFKDPSKEKLQKLLEFIKDKEVAIVAGGGKPARDYISFASIFNLPKGFLDQLAIEITHINARLLARLINGVYCRSFDEVEKFRHAKPVTGGQIPGQSTDAVAAELAEYLGADAIVLVTDVGGIYTMDPKKYSGARKLHKLSFEDLPKLVKLSTAPGSYGVIDPVAAQIIYRSKIKTYVVDMNFNFDDCTEIGNFASML